MLATLSPSERERYLRHILLPEIGEQGQRRLKAAHVLIVGAGGLGCPAALYLAAAGVGRISIADGDRVELSNLHRQVLFGTQDLGALKAQVAVARLRDLNPEVDARALAFQVSADNVMELLRDVDIVLDGSDRLATRYLTNDACVIAGRPWVSAAIHRFEGQTLVYVPGAGPCYRCIFPQADDDLVPNCAEAGVLGVLPAVMGSLQATETLKLILGLGRSPAGRFLTYDALSMAFQEFAASRRADCAVCGDHPTILAPQKPPLRLRPNDPTGDPPGLRRLTAGDLARLLTGSDRTAWTLIDVREPHEYAAGHLAGARNIPLGTLEARWQELPAGAQPVFHCRSGVRSLTACSIAAHRGLAGFANLEGGLLAWARDIDNTLKVI